MSCNHFSETFLLNIAEALLKNPKVALPFTGEAALVDVAEDDELSSVMSVGSFGSFLRILLADANRAARLAA